MSAHLSSMKLDALMLGALDGAALAEAKAHLDGCAPCKAELEQLQGAHAKFQKDVFPRTAPKVREQLERRENRSLFELPRWLMIAVPVGAAALVATVVVRSTVTPQDTYLGIKGGAGLQVFARHGDQVQAIKDGATLAPGDELRFVVNPGGKRYLLVASIDAAGQANIYYPYDGTSSMALPQDPKVELPDSIVLDEAPGPERVFALFSEEPLDARLVTEQLRKIGAQGAAQIRDTRSLPVEGAAQVSFVFEKKTP